MATGDQIVHTKMFSLNDLHLLSDEYLKKPEPKKFYHTVRYPWLQLMEADILSVTMGHS